MKTFLQRYALGFYYQTISTSYLSILQSLNVCQISLYESVEEVSIKIPHASSYQAEGSVELTTTAFKVIILA